MADEPTVVPGPDEEAKEQEKKRKSPKPKFGQILDLGGEYWTIQSSDDGRVTVSRRVGDTVDTRTINEKEYESAAARPLPGNLRSSKPPKGLSVGSYVDAGRVVGYDGVTGDVQVESARGTSWVPGKKSFRGSGAFDGSASDTVGGASGLTGIRSRGGQADEAGEKEGLIDRKVRENLSDLTYGLISKNKKTKGAAPAEVSQGNKNEVISNEVISNKDEVEAVETEMTEPIETVEEIEAEEPDSAEASSDKPDVMEEVTPKTPTAPAVVAQRIVPIGGVPSTPTPTPTVRVSRTIPVGEVPETAPPSSAPAVRVSRTVKVGDAPKPAAPSSVKVSATIPVGQAPKKPSIRETRIELKTQAEEAKTAPAAVEIAATVSAPTTVATPAAGARGVAATALGVTGVALDVLSADRRRPDQQLATEQQALYARAMNAMDVVSSRAADKRQSIQELQSQVDTLRQDISGLNAQAAAPATGAYRAPADVAPRIQAVSQELGATQNKLAMARYGLQTDEAQVQQLRISTNMMRNLAPEVQLGQVPNSIVGLVAQSIPPDVPDPSPARAAALVATLQPGVTAPPLEAPTATAAAPAEAPAAPAPRSFATSTPSAAERPTPASTTGLPESVRARMSRGGLTLPQATAVAFSAGQQADRAAGGYQEGVGSPDAREAAFATEGGGAQPVMKTIQASYTRPERPDLAQDLYEPGGEGASADFMRRQRESAATQEQFQPGSTGGPEATTFAPEAVRAQRIRPGEEGPDEDALRAAKFSADQARTRADALQLFDVSQEEETRLNLSRKQKAFKQLESAKRNFSRLKHLFDTAHGLSDVVGILEVLADMNMRVLTIKFRKGSITRKIFPPAQFPIEVAGIVAMDIILFTVVFVSFCILIAPFIIFWAVIGTGIGGLIYAVTSVAS